ncbi:MAG: hypothetical protein WCD12_20975 [Candidatus Binatus sp.]|uniref:hypothetical protein n=1 Tax=Candidatus Binatus sp. TaxID=2811406 RepID=UPI003C751760
MGVAVGIGLAVGVGDSEGDRRLKKSLTLDVFGVPLEHPAAKISGIESMPRTGARTRRLNRLCGAGFG